MLVIPDFFDRRDVKELVSLLLQQFSFKSILINQVSDKLAAAPSNNAIGICVRSIWTWALNSLCGWHWRSEDFGVLCGRGYGPPCHEVRDKFPMNLILISLHSSHRCCTNFGGYDISRFLLWLLQNSPRHHFPYPECDVNSPQDEAILLDLKRDSCHLDKVIECDILCVSICLLAKSLDSDFLLSCPRIRTTDSSPSHEC